MTDIVERLRSMQGMGDIQLRALMDGVGPQAADEIEWLRKEADKFGDGIDWIQRAMQAEAKIAAMELQEPVEWQCRSRPPWEDRKWGKWERCSAGHAEGITKTPELHGWQYEARALYTLPGAQPAPSVSPSALRPVIQWLRNGCDPGKAADELELLANTAGPAVTTVAATP